METPHDEAEVALMLKTVPTLEIQKKGRSIEIINELNVPKVIVSFPTFNLGIVKKPRVSKEFYEEMFRDMCIGQPWKIEKMDFSAELVFCCSEVVPAGRVNSNKTISLLSLSCYNR